MGAITLDTGEVGSADEWPEFAEWLALVLKLKARETAMKSALARMTEAEIKAHDTETDLLDERFFELMDAITRKPIETERQLVMAAVVWIYDHERNHQSSQQFDLTDYRTQCGEVFAERFVLAAARRTNALLPEVPFISPMEG